MEFLREIWREYRPYAVRLSVDFLVAASIWFGLFAFQCMTEYLPVADWAAKPIKHVHSLGAVAALACFVYYSVIDILNIRGPKGGALCLAW